MSGERTCVFAQQNFHGKVVPLVGFFEVEEVSVGQAGDAAQDALRLAEAGHLLRHAGQDLRVFPEEKARLLEAREGDLCELGLI